MNEDFVKVSKASGSGGFVLEVYFAKVNSTIKIEMSDSDFLRLILESGKLYNENKSFFKINFSEDEVDRFINENREREVKKYFEINKLSIKKPSVNLIIYIADKYVSINESEEITNSCGEFMEALGFELETEDEPVFGSFFKKLKFIFSSTIGDEDLVELYDKGKKALELKHIELPTAEQTEKLAIAAERLVKSLEGVEQGVIRCGALIVVKKIVDGKQKLIIQQLSTEIILILDKHPQLLFNVNTIYELLTGDVDQGFRDTDLSTALTA